MIEARFCTSLIHAFDSENRCKTGEKALIAFKEVKIVKWMRAPQMVDAISVPYHLDYS